jgi:lipid-A-disaccharide synthase
MKYYIIAGEASGDLHGANLVKAIRLLDPTAVFRGFGGDRMAAEGVSLRMHISSLAFMGFVEVLLHLRQILGNIRKCKEDMAAFQPDVVILIDYPGFNLRMAPQAKTLGARVVYYISPQLWAWKAGRVEIVKKFVDKMLVILPFEKDFYLKHQYIVEYVGHPLLDEIVAMAPDTSFRSVNNLPEGRLIALLPGSRKQELKRSLPVMLELAAKCPQDVFVIAAAPSLDRSVYASFSLPPNVFIVYGKTYSLLQEARAAFVTSGTATLETALLQVPQVVCYKGSPISVMIARLLIKVKYISLVNLIMDREIVKERIQSEFNANQLLQDFSELMDDQYRNQLFKDYAELRLCLGGPGASMRAAEAIVHNTSANV